jgi:putative Mg2+ transporter-C (MgtC) family protein
MMEFNLEDLLKILLALLAGGLVGLEREFRDKSAGFRTLIFISIGAAAFTILSSRLALDKDPTRIAANIVTGIGFLGAGTIMREKGKVAGLTTAATIWLAAALGMGIGAGKYALAGMGTAVALIVLLFFPTFEHWLDNIHEARNYEIVIPFDSPLRDELRALFAQHRLKVKYSKETKAEGHYVTLWHVTGHMRGHRALTEMLLANKDVIELKY